MNVELTVLSADEYIRLRDGRMSPKMAAEYLKQERIVLRTFAEALREICPAPDLSARLVDAFLEADPTASRDSIRRKVHNWLSGQSKSTSREDLFIIAFALRLTEAQASFLLGLCTDYGLHYREGRDVVYAWFLRTGGSYRHARDFFATLPPAPHDWDSPEGNSTHPTQTMQGRFLLVQTEQELRECYIANLDQFGRLHARAFRYFQRYLDQLIHPAAAWGGIREPDYSTEALMQRYFSLQMPSSRDRRNYSVVQKLIKHNWPNATLLKNIRNRREDVPRKLLLLLYVITENVMDCEYSELDEDYISAQDRFDDHWYTLNAILTDCGMPLLDPRNATDWLVLYAIAADDGEPMSERMEQVIEHMFSDT